ncbi:MAG: response regulator [Bacteroidales bacterium]|jgi:two-component system sensor histidine kinase/response regulator|nr:response regulator [Bacteroidales bacterium]
MDENTHNILIVDDNPKNLQVLGNILVNNKYNVEYALNGKEALEWANTESFDLILLDVMMPEMDGFEVCEILRKNKDFDDIPIIFLTAKTDKVSTIRGFELNAQDYINKPFDTAELNARIKTHLELKESKDKLKNVNEWLEQEVDKKTKALTETNLKLEETLTELRNLDKMKSYFLNLTSTEIRAPLTGIVGTLHLLKNQEAAFALKDLLNLLEGSVSKLERFANKAILTTELSAKNYNFNPEDINLKELFQFCILELNEDITQKEINVIDENSDIIINGDKNLVFKALLFLIRNAINHTKKANKIELHLAEKENKIICRIIDYGEGFSDDTIKNIYSPFRFNEKDFDKNNELSMYLINLIMEYHNGEFNVYNEENAGACVELIFKNQ